MPVVRPGMRKPPPGFDAVAEKLDVFEEEMKQAVQDDSKGVVGQTTKPRRQGKRPREVTDEAAGSDAEDDKPKTSDGDGGEADHVKEVAAAPPTAVPPLWRVAQINQARTRYVFNACFRERRISKEVFDYCCDMNLIDGGLAKRWRLPGYEALCCTACAVPGAASVAANITSKFALRDRQERKVRAGVSASSRASGSDTATCICRVPAAQRSNKAFLACAVCGCRGCCSADAPASAKESGASK